MAKTSETGHAINVANFEKLISYLMGYGTRYNPSKDLIKISNLQNVLTLTKGALDSVSMAQSAYAGAVAARKIVFEPLNKYATRILNALRASGSSEQIDASAQSLVHKIQGVRASAKKSDEEKKALEAEGKEVTEISSAQTSFDNRLANFDKLVKLLATIPEYAPNEEDLKVATLTTYCTSLGNKNQEVIAAETALSNARIARNKVLYEANTGMTDVVADVKSYVKSVFEASSPEYKQISKLSFS